MWMFYGFVLFFVNFDIAEPRPVLFILFCITKDISPLVSMVATNTYLWPFNLITFSIECQQITKKKNDNHKSQFPKAQADIL